MKKFFLCLLFLCAAAAALFFVGCSDEGTTQAATITKTEWDYAQQESNFTVVFASVSESGERYSAELKAAGETFCLTTEYGSTYYKKEDGVYKRRTEQDAQWSSTEESRIGDCLGLRFPYYASFFDRSIDLSMFTAEGSLLTAQPALLEKLSTAGADFSNTTLLYTGIEVSFLQVRLIDGRFYTASAEAVYGGETVFAEYLFHSYGTTEVTLPSASSGDVVWSDGTSLSPPTAWEGDNSYEAGDIFGDNRYEASDILGGNRYETGDTIWDGSCEGEVGDIPSVDPGVNETPVIGGVIGGSGDWEIGGSDFDDEDFRIFPEENEPATEPHGFPEGHEPTIED